jgi:hypothetical protein
VRPVEIGKGIRPCCPHGTLGRFGHGAPRPGAHLATLPRPSYIPRVPPQRSQMTDSSKSVFVQKRRVVLGEPVSR